VNQAGGVVVAEQVIELVVDFANLPAGFGGKRCHTLRFLPERFVAMAIKRGPVVELLPLTVGEAGVVGMGLGVNFQRQFGQVHLGMFEIIGGASLDGMAQIDAFDEFGEQITHRLIERTDLACVNLRNGNADRAENVELIRLVKITTIDPMRRNFQDRFVAAAGGNGEGGADGPAMKRGYFSQFSGRADPIMHDAGKRLPRDVTV